MPGAGGDGEFCGGGGGGEGVVFGVDWLYALDLPGHVAIEFVAVLVEGGGRVSPRRATHFLLLRQEKVSKEKATQLSATPALRYGATCVGEFTGCAVELATRCALHSDNHGESVHEACVSCGTHATPQTPRHRRNQMGVCFGPLLRSATKDGRAAPRLAWAERSDGPRPPLLCAPGARRARGGGCAAGHTRINIWLAAVV